MLNKETKRAALIVLGIGLVFILASLLSSTSFAATSGSIVLNAVVPQLVSVTVTPTNNPLTLSLAGVNVLIGTVLESSNSVAGYTVKLSSLNAGSLKNGTLGSHPYTLQYNAVTAALTVAPVTITNQGAQTSVVNFTKNVTVSFAGANDMQGTYSDTLTFSIVAN